MRTLKRALAFALVLVLCFGLVGSAFALSLDDMTDKDEVQYVEAVSVMIAIGAIDGMGDGTFNPKGNVTRAQAAKMVAYAILGERVASMLPNNGSSFSDVKSPDYDWAIPCIEYLVEIGAIAGLGDGTFDPGGSVTGYQIAKMMLCAAGYGKNGEFVGNGWDLRVATLAFSLGIFRGSKATNYNAAATREECALYAFNGITKVERVNWTKDEEAYVPASGSAFANPVTLSVTIARKAYGLDLVHVLADAGGVDSFGRPADVWTYKGEEVAANSITPVASFTAKTSLANVEAATTKKGYDIEATPSSFRNNEKQVAATWVGTAASLSSFTGNGVLVEAFETVAASKDIDVVTAIVTQLYHVSNINSTTKAVTIARDSDTNTFGTATYSIATTSALYSSVKDLAVGDEILVVLSHDGAKYVVAEISLPTYVTGTVSTTSGAGGDMTLTVGGTVYGLSYARKDLGIPATSTPNEFTFTLDNYGYIIAAEGVASDKRSQFYGYDTYITSVDGKFAYMVTGIWNDGTVADLRLPSASDLDWAEDLLTPGKPNAQGIYNLATPTSATAKYASPSSAAAGNGTGSSLPDGTVIALGGSPTSFIDASDSRLDINSGVGADAANRDHAGGAQYFNNFFASDVKFIYINPNKTTSVKTGVQAIQKIPNDSFALIETRPGSTVPVVTAVFIKGSDVAYDASSLIFVATNSSVGSQDCGGTNYSTYKGYLNGAEHVFPGAQPSVADDNQFYTYTISATGVYTLTPFTESATLKVATETSIASNTSIIDNRLFDIGGSHGAIDLSSATFMDLRSATDKEAYSIGLSAVDFAHAIKGTNTIVVNVIYSDKKVASYVYITGRTA